MEVSGNQFDLIVVGGGIMGSCTAYEAAKRGHRVLLLEQFDFLHHLGSSHGESRTIPCTYPEHYYTQMVLESFRLWGEAQSEVGYRVLTETTQFDMGPAGNKSLQSVVANSTGASSNLEAQVLNHSQVADKFSGTFGLPEDWIGVATERAGIIKPTKALAMFQALAIRRGAVLKDRMEVVDINKDRRAKILVTTSAKHQFWANKCVVTAGAWTQKLVKTVSGLHLPIQPLHTVICYWKIKQGFEKHLSPEGGFPTFASYGSPYIYGTPSIEFPGLIKIAMHGGHRCDPDQRDWNAGKSTNSGSLIKPVRQCIREVMPDRVEADGPVLTQACMYSMTPDEDFVIDFLGGEFGKDVVVAGGFSGHGFKMGPVIGRILAQMAINGSEGTGVEMEWFRLRRFDDDTHGNVKEFEDQVSSHTTS
ncbi:putative sarcosine oxidase [Iris pallida]|uniref:Sarcosine oxidase n=1 Tax=Iris pallida TaxID=29817 RepID=A0AAX6EZ47_IRIPA|nr:putative sarcosine oxidase [Iris pallida]